MFTLIPDLWSKAHDLLAEVCDTASVTKDDTSSDPAVIAALELLPGGMSQYDYFTKVSYVGGMDCSWHWTAVGIGSNKEKRLRSAKFALAIHMAVDSVHTFRDVAVGHLVNDLVVSMRALTPQAAPSVSWSGDALVPHEGGAASFQANQAEVAAKGAPGLGFGHAEDRASSPESPPSSSSWLGDTSRPRAENESFEISRDGGLAAIGAPEGEIQNKTSAPGPSNVGRAALNLTHIWCPTGYDVVNGMGDDQSIVLTEGAPSAGPFVAFGQVVCSERYLLWQAQICNRSFLKAPLNLNKLLQFPHMTLGKLEHGYADRRANRSLWVVDSSDGQQELDVASIVDETNEWLKRDTIVFRLHTAHFAPNYHQHRYDISGGEAYTLFRTAQTSLRARLGQFADYVQFWAQAPALPHITFEYPDYHQDDFDWAQDLADTLSQQSLTSTQRASTRRSRPKSLEFVLEQLEATDLGHLRGIVEHECLSASVLPAVTDQDLKDVGVKALGDRKKLLHMASHFGDLTLREISSA
jgi:hypothetical protein